MTEIVSTPAAPAAAPVVHTAADLHLSDTARAALAAGGHKPLGGRFEELTRPTSAQPRRPACPSETAFDAALEDFERLRTSMSYPALLAAPPSAPDPGSGEVWGDLLTTEADGDHGERRGRGTSGTWTGLEGDGVSRAGCTEREEAPEQAASSVTDCPESC
ncbi:hypothetical protein [Streptosporangium roseum]|uniref:hypothetical protein n=1 Tax=Streptosporangium roseum TaxID=2001 RepID=UPI00331A490D